MGLCFAQPVPFPVNPIESNSKPTGVTLNRFDAKQPTIFDHIRMIFTK